MDFQSIVVELNAVVKDVVGDGYAVENFIVQQSKFIAQGVDSGGAGDQGIMVGYATSETASFMPLEYELARDLCEKIYAIYTYDGKVQVTLDGSQVTCVVASFQNTNTEALLALVQNLIVSKEYLINPAGQWPVGGFDADSGLSGRKIVIDNYGPQVPVGGGSFSGKDATKVDRSAAYMARFAAKNIVVNGYANQCIVKIAYAIGKSEPVMLIAQDEASTDLSEILKKHFDFHPQAIIERLNLRQPIFAQTAESGHFGHKDFPWEKTIKL